MKTAFVVLGMHRSGTSAVAGSLAMAGVTAPTSLMPAKPDNPLGFWESERIVEFDNEILKRLGSHWQDWGSADLKLLDNAYRPNLEHAASWVLDVEFNNAESVLLKDPRICRFYPFWRDQLATAGYRPVVISPVRSPDQVAQSLVARNGMPRTLALRLWLRHVLDAERFTRGQTRHIVTIDDLGQDWRNRFDRLSTDLGLSMDWRDTSRESRIDRFWSGRPVSGNGDTDTPGTLHPLVSRAWNIFIDISAQGETPHKLDELDEICLEFDTLSEFFYDWPVRGID